MSELRTTTRRAVLSLAAVGALGAATVAGMPSAAAAPRQCDVVVCQTTSSAQAEFWRDNGDLALWDSAADGHHVVVYYKTSNHPAERSLTNYWGKGTGNVVNLSIPRTGWIQMTVCTAEGSTLLSCSGWKKWTVKGPTYF